ncbi:protein phosphatase 2C [Reticulomyxa filosa]|uniref:Protein phosphatase 2C n=1 Tax=Reticulomyxa filosa TaxID=46433 RepID=X6LVT5_RETFI|nr:protein phosphatase 2C [Reticulomyxa filosa]|eukprot:ETO05739.1 protein phosphatase 2C [Reticulomyxa filosa]
MSSISEESELLDALALSYLDDLEGSPQDLSVSIDWGESSTSELVQKTRKFCDIEKYITNDTLIISREDLTLDMILEWLEFFDGINHLRGRGGRRSREEEEEEERRKRIRRGDDNNDNYNNDNNNERRSKSWDYRDNKMVKRKIILKGIELWSCGFSRDENGEDEENGVIESFGDFITVVSNMNNNNNNNNSNEHFEHLKLGYNNLKDEGLSKLMNCLINLENLQTLQLSYNDLSWQALDMFVEMFEHPLCKMKKNLKILDLSGNKNIMESNSESILAFQSFVMLALQGSNIKELRLCALNWKEEQISNLCEWLLTEECNVSILDMSKTIWKESIITILCETLNQGIIGTDDKFKKRKLQYQIPTKIECITINHLKLNYCVFEGKGAKILGMSLFHNRCIHTLDLIGMTLSNFLDFAHSPNILKISRLDVSCLYIRSQQTSAFFDFQDFSDGIISILAAKCIYLQVLNISHCDLNNDECKDISAFIHQHAFLRKIDLTRNALNSQVVDSLIYSVLENRKFCIQYIKQYIDVICQCADFWLDTSIDDQLDQLCINQSVYFTKTSANSFLNMDEITDNNNDNNDNNNDNNDNNDNDIPPEKSLGQQLDQVSIYHNPSIINEPDKQMLKMLKGGVFFPLALCGLILSFLFEDPLVGIKSIVLTGNRVAARYVSMLRQTRLIDTNKMKQIAFQRFRTNDPFFMKQPTAWP